MKTHNPSIKTIQLFGEDCGLQWLVYLPKKVLANILLEGLGEYEGESLLKSSELGDGA